MPGQTERVAQGSDSGTVALPPAVQVSRDEPRRRRVVAAAVQHPLVAVAGIALVTRVAASLALGLRPGYAVPDEQQYVDLAHFVATGRGAEAWFPGYGQSLYDSTYSFSMPLAALERLFGPHQILGQLIAVTFGVVTAVLTTLLALRFLDRRWALAAGLVAALLPSQVYWSSVSLRESMVWACLAGIAVAVAVAARATSARTLVATGALCFACLLALGHLRQQTLLAAVGALAVSTFTFRLARPVVVRVAAVGLAAVVPMIAGLGPGGYYLVEQAVPKLAIIRHNLAQGADSAFVHDPVVTPTTAAGSASTGSPSDGTTASGPRPKPSTRGNVAGPATTSLPPQAPDGRTYVAGPEGRTYVVDDSANSNLKAIPKGLVAVAVRPFPWDPATNTSVLFAKAETVLWLALYVLAAIGIWAGRRHRSAITFPVLVTGAIVIAAAVSQGNLGTAFRHRGQVLWALAPLAALGAAWLVERYRHRHTAEPEAPAAA